MVYLYNSGEVVNSTTLIFIHKTLDTGGDNFSHNGNLCLNYIYVNE